jgi:GNAT superfamily N-acetyltransferase
VEIRGGRLSDVPRLGEIEVAGSTLFATHGMFNEELRGPMSPADITNLETHIAAGHLWVADVDGTVAAYVMTSEVDGNAHVDQVTVDPDFGRQRIGRALIEYAVDVARTEGFAQMTLTTYRDVPWNGPYYERLGFVILSADALPPAIRAIRDHERELGLDKWPRVAMVREL